MKIIFTFFSESGKVSSGCTAVVLRVSLPRTLSGATDDDATGGASASSTRTIAASTTTTSQSPHRASPISSSPAETTPLLCILRGATMLCGCIPGAALSLLPLLVRVVDVTNPCVALELVPPMHVRRRIVPATRASARSACWRHRSIGCAIFESSPYTKKRSRQSGSIAIAQCGGTLSCRAQHSNNGVRTFDVRRTSMFCPSMMSSRLASSTMHTHCCWRTCNNRWRKEEGERVV